MDRSVQVRGESAVYPGWPATAPIELLELIHERIARAQPQHRRTPCRPVLHARGTTRPLERIAVAAGQLAAGDLTMRLSGSGTPGSGIRVRDDEIGRLMHAVDGIGEGLARITLVDEAADVSRSLDAQATSLDGAVSAFKLAHDARSA